MENEITRIDADIAAVFKGRDIKYQVLISGHLPPAMGSGPVAEKPRRFLKWKWRRSKKSEKEGIPGPP